MAPKVAPAFSASSRARNQRTRRTLVTRVGRRGLEPLTPCASWSSRKLVPIAPITERGRLQSAPCSSPGPKAEALAQVELRRDQPSGSDRQSETLLTVVVADGISEASGTCPHGETQIW